MPKTFGMAPFSKAAVGFLGQTFSFCSACGKWLEEKDRATDKEKIAKRHRDNPLAPAANSTGVFEF